MSDTKFPFISALEKTIQKYIEDNNLVEVVRCKDCKYRTVDNDVARYNCGLHLVVNLNDNDFCSRGERKENEKTD